MNIRVKITRPQNPDCGKIITIDLEEYLRGVVPAEMYASYHLEALKAQAVAARTYAVKKMLARKNEPFDVDDTTKFQAYRPHDRISASTDAAVKATAGQTLTYDGKLIDAVYTDSNGGHTLSAKERWGNHVPYLPSIPDPYDTSGKISGHGVGMSQRGANEAAKQGLGYEAILAFYYPGTRLQNTKEENDMGKVQIGHARHDELGKITGGKAGDQTGQEVMISDWYKHKLGWVVLRAKTHAQAHNIAEAARRAAANANIGYDQAQRNTLYNAVKGLGFDPAKVTTPVETDCSALVRVCCALAGIELPDFNTSSEADTLMKSGQFMKLTDAKYTSSSDYLCVGDILVTKTKGHTAIVLDDGPKAYEGVPEAPTAPQKGFQAAITGASVNIRKGPGSGHAVVTIAHKEDRFTVEPASDGWHRITQGKANGIDVSGLYISASYVKAV